MQLVEEPMEVNAAFRFKGECLEIGVKKPGLSPARFAPYVEAPDPRPTSSRSQQVFGQVQEPVSDGNLGIIETET